MSTLAPGHSQASGSDPATHRRTGLLRLRHGLHPRGPAVAGRPVAGGEATTVEEPGTGRRRHDRVIVDPRGVFLLETTNLNGVLEIRDGAAWLRRRHGPAADRPLRELRERALTDAALVAEEFREQIGRLTSVTAVIVVWSAFPDGVVETDGVLYVHGSRLGAWLSSRPTSLDRTAVAELGGALTVLKRRGDARAESCGSRPRVRGARTTA